jgi:hypothetical protein
VSDGVAVGHNLEQDRASHHVSASGIVVVSGRCTRHP